MKNNLRFICDTNVFISYLFSENTPPAQAVKIIFQEGMLLVSEETVIELINVLSRQKFDKYFSLEKRLTFIEELTDLAIYITPTETITDCRDPKDNKFLELAVSGQADYIITGDQDLLVLHPFRDISILNPTAFLKQFT